MQQHRQQQSSQHVIQQLQKALQCERKQLRQLRTAYTAELGRRNELQTLLLDSIQQAKQQHQQAKAAHAAASQADAEAAGGTCGQPDSSGGRPSSKLSARPQHRPLSAAPCSGRQRPWSAADTAAGHACLATAPADAAPAGGWQQVGFAAGEPVLDQQAWGKLLEDLLSRQRVLELLLQRACPDLVAAAQQLHQGQHASAAAAADAGAIQQQQARDAAAESRVSQPLGQPVVQQPAQDDGLQPFDVEGGDMFMIEEDEGVSPASDNECEGCGSQSYVEQLGSDQQHNQPEPCGSGGMHERQQRQQQAQQLQRCQEEDQELVQQQQQQLPVQPWGSEPQQDPDPGQQQQHTESPPLRQTVAVAGSSPTHSRSTAPSAAAPSGPPYLVQRPPVGVVTLGSMSGPVMGSFPVRKLLHSGSSSSASHSSHAAQHSHQRKPSRGSDGGICSSSSSLQRVHSQHRRPETAAAASGSRVALGLGSFAVRPGSATDTVGAAGLGSSHRAQHSSSALQHSPGQIQQQAGGNSRPKEQHQHMGMRQQQSGAVPAASGADGGLSIRSWGSPDGGRTAQLMLKSFLQGQH